VIGLSLVLTMASATSAAEDFVTAWPERKCSAGFLKGLYVRPERHDKPKRTNYAILFYAMLIKTGSLSSRIHMG
jgi:hypothetical protein